MSMKRGVSLYSYQQAQFFKQMDLLAMVQEVHDNLGTDGIEIIDEQMIKGYPFPSREFIFNFRNTLARYDMQAVTMDINLDPLHFRDHVMTHGEAAERLIQDIKIASALGFKNVRCVGTPIDSAEKAIPYAEKYDVRIGFEIHAPNTLFLHGKPAPTGGVASMMNFHLCEEVIEISDRLNTKYIGLIPDFGLFQHSISSVAVDYMKRHCSNPEAIDYCLDHKREYTVPDMIRKLEEVYPGSGLKAGSISQLMQHEMYADPEDLKIIIPYIVSIHGKFYHMTEIDGMTGEYEDKAIDYETPMKVLVENGYEGYINSEYEGQRMQQDNGFENLADEVDEVRKHHKMLKRLIGESAS